MLVLTRKAGETIELSGGIVITIRSWTPKVATVTISAPEDVKDVWDAINRYPSDAAVTVGGPFNGLVDNQGRRQDVPGVV